jgi:hypothetical protein
MNGLEKMFATSTATASHSIKEPSASAVHTHIKKVKDREGDDGG